MSVAQGKGEALAAALAGLVPGVLAQAGYTGIDTFGDCDNPNLFLFVEKWVSVDAHKTGPGALPADGLPPVMAALACPPEGSYAGHLRSVAHPVASDFRSSDPMPILAFSERLTRMALVLQLHMG